jgi:hypothetical protein
MTILETLARGGVPLVLIGCALAALPAHAVSIRTVALTDTDGVFGPGAGAGVEFSSFDSPAIDSAGMVIIDANGAGANGFFVNDGSANSAVALPGTDGPLGPGAGPGVEFLGIGGANSSNFWVLRNDAGQIAHGASLTGSGATTANRDVLVVTGDTTGSTIIARTDDGTPGPSLGAGVQFSSLESRPPAAMNDSGALVFRARLEQDVLAGVDGNNDSGVWTTIGGTLAAIAREGDLGALGPGLGGDIVFDQFASGSAPNVLLNDADEILLLARLRGTGVNAANNDALFAYAPGGAPVLVARDGDVFGSAGVVETLSRTGFNDAGEIAVRIVGSIETASSAHGRRHARRARARRHRRRTRTEPRRRHRFGILGTAMMTMNGAGAVVFERKRRAWVSRRRVDCGARCPVRLMIVLSGVDDARGPGLGAGISFFPNSFDDLHLNANGDAAFLAQVDGGSYSQTRHLCGGGRPGAPDRGGRRALRRRSRSGLDLAPDRRRGVARPNHGFSGEDGRTRLLNDAGELAFQLFFEDGPRGSSSQRCPSPRRPASGRSIALLAAVRCRRARVCAGARNLDGATRRVVGEGARGVSNARPAGRG